VGTKEGDTEVTTGEGNCSRTEPKPTEEELEPTTSKGMKPETGLDTDSHTMRTLETKEGFVETPPKRQELNEDTKPEPNT